MICEAGEKIRRLVGLLEEIMDGNKILIFCASKRRCDELTRELRWIPSDSSPQPHQPWNRRTGRGVRRHHGKLSVRLPVVAEHPHPCGG